MSCPIYCPECDSMQGDVGLCASGKRSCSECGEQFEIGYQTMADMEDQ